MPDPHLLSLPRHPIGPLPFRVAPFADCVSGVLAAAGTHRGLAVHFANAYTIALADADDDYARMLADPDAVALHRRRARRVVSNT